MSPKIQFYINILKFLGAGGAWKTRCRVDVMAASVKCRGLSWVATPERLESLDASLNRGGVHGLSGVEEKLAVAALKDLSPETNDASADVMNRVMEACGVTGRLFAIWARDIKRHKKGRGGVIILHVSDVEQFKRFIAGIPGQGGLVSGKVIT